MFLQSFHISTALLIYLQKLEVFREDIPGTQFQCQQAKLFAMHAHNYTRLNICSMLCTSYYVGYLHSIKASWVIILSN